jgi:hypothetical protein
VTIRGFAGGSSLPQINAEYCDIHQNAPLSTYAHNNSCGLAGKQFIPLAQNQSTNR